MAVVPTSNMSQINKYQQFFRATLKVRLGSCLGMILCDQVRLLLENYATLANMSDYNQARLSLVALDLNNHMSERLQ